MSEETSRSLAAGAATEVWQRGAVPGYAALLQPVAHALLQVREDLERLAATVPTAHTWQRPGGAASIGFHVRHTGGALDRLLTYARGEVLSDRQRESGRVEGEPGLPAMALGDVVAEAVHCIDLALEQVRRTDVSTLSHAREVGRARLPSTVLGLLFHAAEHSTRHVGQAITTAKILAGQEAGKTARPNER